MARSCVTADASPAAPRWCGWAPRFPPRPTAPKHQPPVRGAHGPLRARAPTPLPTSYLPYLKRSSRGVSALASVAYPPTATHPPPPSRPQAHPSPRSRAPRALPTAPPARPCLPSAPLQPSPPCPTSLPTYPPCRTRAVAPTPSATPAVVDCTESGTAMSQGRTQRAGAQAGQQAARKTRSFRLNRSHTCCHCAGGQHSSNRLASSRLTSASSHSR